MAKNKPAPAPTPEPTPAPTPAPTPTVEDVVRDYVNYESSSTKATTAFKTLVGYPDCNWNDAEKLYGEVMKGIDKKYEKARGALRQLMTWIRKNDSDPWQKAKDGTLFAALPEASSSGKQAGKQAGKKDNETPVFTDDMVLIRIGVLANQFITSKDDLATFARICIVIHDTMHLATSGK